MPHLPVSLSCPTNVPEAWLDIVRDGLTAANTQATGRDATRQPLAVLARDPTGAVVGGAIGFTRWDWLHVDHVWVHTDCRGTGIGRDLMRAAESEAIDRGCTHAILDTFSFQARPFYESLGYRVFATLDDFPTGHAAHFLSKALTP